MARAICNTSPLLYLYRIKAIDLLPLLFEEVWVPEAVVEELSIGRRSGYDAPNPADYTWGEIANPRTAQSEWLATDLGPGELAVLALALENPDCVVLLDDLMARRTARAAGLQVWGTLKVLLESKSRGFITSVEPFVNHLIEMGMWIDEDLRRRILTLAGEA